MYMSIFIMYIYCLYIILNIGICSIHETCRITPISPHVRAMLSKFTRLVPHQIAIFCFRKALFLMDVAPSWSWGLNLRQWGNSHLSVSRFPDQIEDFDVFLTDFNDFPLLGLWRGCGFRNAVAWCEPEWKAWPEVKLSTRWVSLNKTFSGPVLAMRIYKGEAGNVF